MTAGEFVERVVAKSLTLADRVTHTWHRRRARLRMRRRPRPARILMLCYGNICRSPYAEATLRQRLQSLGISGIEVSSAGLYGPDRNANDQATVIGGERGIDLTRHRSRLIQTSEAGNIDLILVMTRSQRRTITSQFGVPSDQVELLGDFDTADPRYREIIDPYGREDAVFRTVFNQIERSVNGLCSCWVS